MLHCVLINRLFEDHLRRFILRCSLFLHNIIYCWPIRQSQIILGTLASGKLCSDVGLAEEKSAGRWFREAWWLFSSAVFLFFLEGEASNSLLLLLLHLSWSQTGKQLSANIWSVARHQQNDQQLQSRCWWVMRSRSRQKRWTSNIFLSCHWIILLLQPLHTFPEYLLTGWILIILWLPWSAEGSNSSRQCSHTKQRLEGNVGSRLLQSQAVCFLAW